MAESIDFRIELVCTARNRSARQHANDIKRGTFPPADVPVRGNANHPARAWSLEVLQRHDPALARRCLALSTLANLTNIAA